MEYLERMGRWLRVDRRLTEAPPEETNIEEWWRKTSLQLAILRATDSIRRKR